MQGGKRGRLRNIVVVQFAFLLFSLYRRRCARCHLRRRRRSAFSFSSCFFFTLPFILFPLPPSFCSIVVFLHFRSASRPAQRRTRNSLCFDSFLLFLFAAAKIVQIEVDLKLLGGGTAAADLLAREDMRTHTHTPARTHTHTHTHAHAYTHAYTHTCTYTHKHIHAHAYTHTP